MYPLEPSEILIENRFCKQCQQSFAITSQDQDFLQKLSPVIGENKLFLPFPTLCPECRKIRRNAWRNLSKIYKRTCDATGIEFISLFSPDVLSPVYTREYWYSDTWNAMDYAKDFDFSVSFFEQWQNLKAEVPMPGRAISQNMENSEYSDNCSNMKNCYLCFNAWNLEDSLYTTDALGSKDCIDCMSIFNCHKCYEVAEWNNCYQTHFSYNVKNCADGQFLYNCDGCTSCYGCFDLENQQYCIFNEQYTEESYIQKMKEIRNLSLTEQRNRVKLFLKNHQFTIKPLKNEGCENVWNTTNSHNAKNISHSSQIRDSEDIRYCVDFSDTKLAMDSNIWWDRTERIYESHQIGESCSQTFFSLCCWANVSNLFYCAYCITNVHNCFGCVGLRNASYCILNKQYTKEEYEVLVPKIIKKMIADGEWGEFFPSSLSHFGYNQTINMEKYPITKEVARKQWFHWSDYEAPFPKVEKIIPANKLPDTIDTVPDDILNWAIECEVSKKPFRIIRQELEFYRKHNLPIPKRHPDQRHRDRMALRNPRKLYERRCDCCHKNMITSYAPERPEIVYCEECYMREVKG